VMLVALHFLTRRIVSCAPHTSNKKKFEENTRMAFFRGRHNAAFMVLATIRFNTGQW